MAMAVPIAVGVALCLTQYLHKRAAAPISFVVDLLAAVAVDHLRALGI
jgi:phosphate transport system permease protein